MKIPKYENTLFEVLLQYEPEKLNIISRKNLGNQQIEELIVYEDLDELFELTRIGKKSINLFLNVKSKTMNQAQADIMARALSKKLQVKIDSLRFLKVIED